MPFAAVVGVNHHGHSILLGCALVTQEYTDSFKWIFSNWIEAMGGIHPTAIITDQAEAIRNAIRDVMSNTIHRFCMWHILCKAPEKFKHLRNVSRATNELKEVVYDSLNIQIF
ncbi:hypothetical protein ACS0TY_008072 [Phlomoides rotata]